MNPRISTRTAVDQPRRSARWLVGAVALIGWAALACNDPNGVVCPDGGVNPPTFLPSGTHLGVSIQFVDPKRLIDPADSTSSGWLRVDGYLVPGLFPDGPKDQCGFPIESRPVLNDTLRVAGLELVPVVAGTKSYHAEMAMSSAQFAALPIDLDPPDVAGVTPDTTTFRWFGPGRAGEDSVIIQPGDDVELVIIPPDAPSTPMPRYRGWHLAVTGDSTSIQLSGDGSPPDTLVVSRQLLPPAAQGEWSAILSLTQQWFDDPYYGQNGYAIDLLLDVQLGWRVRLVP